MDDDRYREIAKVSINLCLAGIAGTIPTLALILNRPRLPAVEFLFLPLPEAAYVVLWLFVIGAISSTISLRVGIAWLTSFAYLLWLLGTFWLVFSLGYAIVPANKVLVLLTVPMVIFSLGISFLFRKASRDTAGLAQQIQAVEAKNQQAAQALEARIQTLQALEEKLQASLKRIEEQGGTAHAAGSTCTERDP